MSEQQMKSARFGVVGFGLVAFSCALLAGWVVVQLINASRMKEEAMVEVVVAVRNIPGGEPLLKDAVKVVSMPQSLAPKAAVRSLDDLFKDGKTRIAASGILEGEAIFEARLADPSRGTAMASMVRPGYRAVPVKVDNAVARSGLLYPGAFVDVVGTIRDPKTFVSTTRLVVENVKVLSVEAALDVETYRSPNAQKKEGDGQPQQQVAQPDAVATIEVTPPQSEVVLLAQREGRLDLALRNAADKASVATNGANPTSMMGESAKKRAATDDRPERHRLLEGRAARRTVQAAGAPVVSSP